MVVRITAFQSSDGRIHTDENEAEFAEFSIAIQQDAADFLAQRGVADPDNHMQRMLCDWELWRQGGYAGWLKRCEEERADMQSDAQVVPAPPVLLPAPEANPEAEDKSAPPPATNSERSAARSPRRTAPAKTHLKHVGVVGLNTPLHSVIEREFCDCFKLTILDSDCMNRLSSLKGCHKVFAMTNFISHKHIETLRAFGQEPYRVAGGVSTLKNALTDYYAA